MLEFRIAPRRHSRLIIKNTIQESASLVHTPACQVFSFVTFGKPFYVSVIDLDFPFICKWKLLVVPTSLGLLEVSNEIILAKFMAHSLNPQ